MMKWAQCQMMYQKMLTAFKNDKVIKTNSDSEEEKIQEFREKFFNFLLKKPCTSGQAAEYLSKLNVPENFYDLLLDEAEKLKLIDDLAYSKLFIDGHLTWGNAKIIYELSRRGVSRDNINEALNESEDENSRAYQLADDWGKLGIDEQKIVKRLLSRGFSHRSTRTSGIDINNERE